MTDEINKPFMTTPLPKMPTTSYAAQLARANARDDRLPLLGVDADMNVNAQALVDNATRNAMRRYDQINQDEVER